MGFDEGIRLLQELGARPDALYWEGFPHEENVVATLKLVHEVGARGGEMEIGRSVHVRGRQGRVSYHLMRSNPRLSTYTHPGVP